MGIFDDKRYDELDWVSQAVQPIVSPLTQILDSIPERIDVTAYILESNSTYGTTLSNIINLVLKTTEGWNKGVSWTERSLIEKCFSIEMPEQVILDKGRNTMSAPIFLVKTQFLIEENDLKKTLGEKGLSDLRNISYDHMDISRCNEMLDLLEKCDDAIRSRSLKIKRTSLYRRVGEIFTSNEWNVKSSELADKICLWISRYIRQGDLAALSNITRLKVITYKGAPIYSIEEQK